MDKIHRVGTEMQAVFSGLTRGLDLTVLDDGLSPLQLRAPRPRPRLHPAEAIRPGVHALWLPAIPLKMPLVLKPGREEPWTPYRIAQALIAAGCPPRALSYYPTDHSGSTEILLRCGRSLLFGGGSYCSALARRPSRPVTRTRAQQDHHRRRTKIDQWEALPRPHGRLNRRQWGAAPASTPPASGCPPRGREIATALGERLSQIQARPPRRSPSSNRRLPQSRRGRAKSQP